MADVDDFEPDPDFVPDNAGPRKSKYPQPKSMSADDQSLGLETGGQKKTIGNFVAGYPGGVKQDVIGPEAKRLQGLEQVDRLKEFAAEVGGQAAGGLVVPIGEGIGAPIIKKVASSLAGKAGSALPKTAEFVRKAIEHSQSEHGKLALARAVGEDVATAARKVGATGAGAIGAVAPTSAAQAGGAAGGALARPTGSLPAAPDVPEGSAEGAQPGHQSSLHNAVDRLRAQAGNNPRAADLLARMQASKNTPSGTVTQSTGVA